MISVRQVKAARALLGRSQSDLARQSGISEPAIVDGIHRWEIGRTRRDDKGNQYSVRSSERRLKTLEENGTGEGVRFRKPRRLRRSSIKLVRPSLIARFRGLLFIDAIGGSGVRLRKHNTNAARRGGSWRCGCYGQSAGPSVCNTGMPPPPLIFIRSARLSSRGVRLSGPIALASWHRIRLRRRRATGATQWAFW